MYASTVPGPTQQNPPTRDKAAYKLIQLLPADVPLLLPPLQRPSLHHSHSAHSAFMSIGAMKGDTQAFDDNRKSLCAPLGPSMRLDAGCSYKGWQPALGILPDHHSYIPLGDTSRHITWPALNKACSWEMRRF